MPNSLILPSSEGRDELRRGARFSKKTFKRRRKILYPRIEINPLKKRSIYGATMYPFLEHSRETKPLTTDGAERLTNPEYKRYHSVTDKGEFNQF